MSTQAPRMPGRPFVGNLFEFVKNPTGFLWNLFHTYGDVAAFRLPGQTITLFSHPEGADLIQRQTGTLFAKEDLRFLEVPLRRSLVVSQGELWRKQRRLLQPYFQQHRALAATGSITAATRRMLDEWSSLLSTGVPFEVGGEFARLTIEIAARSLFGPSFRPSHLDVMVRAAHVLPIFLVKNVTLPFIPWQVPLPWNRAMVSSMKELQSLVDGFIRERTYNDSPDVLSMVLQDHEDLDLVQLRDELIGLFFGSFETSFVSLSWAVYLLAQNPTWWERLRAEVDRVVGDGELTSADFRKLVDTHNIVQEVLRLYPAFPLLQRKTTQDVEISNHPMHAGEHVMFSAWVTHRHPEFWEDAERFNPDRFNREESAHRHRGAYFPFGAGPRICIGRNFSLVELTVVLVMLAQRYELQLVPDHPAVEPCDIPIRPRNGIWVTLRQRSGQKAA